ncbi:MAG TPA: hypothetical protein PK467_16225, partial [Candidatus Wallbacteria bacterium]|nr:hypothetical protein [Candidatus Wallbacteria bacterium]
IGADAPLTGTISVIMTMNEDGTNHKWIKTLTPGDKWNFRSPVYGPLGDRIYYSRVSDAGNYEVYCLWARDSYLGKTIEDSNDLVETKITQLDSAQDADYISVGGFQKIGWYYAKPDIMIYARDAEGHGAGIYYNWTNDAEPDHLLGASTLGVGLVSYKVPYTIPEDDREWREQLSYKSSDIDVLLTYEESNGLYEDYFLDKQDSGNVELSHEFIPLMDDMKPTDEIRIHIVDRDGATLGTDKDNSLEYTSETSVGSKNGYGGDNVLKTAEVSLLIDTHLKFGDWVYISNFETAPVGFEPVGASPLGYETEPVSLDVSSTTNVWLRAEKAAEYFYPELKWTLKDTEESGTKKIYAWYGSEGRVIRLVSEEVYVVTDIPVFYKDRVYITTNSNFALGTKTANITIENDSINIPKLNSGTYETPIINLGSHIKELKKLHWLSDTGTDMTAAAPKPITSIQLRRGTTQQYSATSWTDWITVDSATLDGATSEIDISMGVSGVFFALSNKTQGWPAGSDEVLYIQARFGIDGYLRIPEIGFSFERLADGLRAYNDDPNVDTAPVWFSVYQTMPRMNFGYNTKSSFDNPMYVKYYWKNSRGMSGGSADDPLTLDYNTVITPGSIAVQLAGVTYTNQSSTKHNPSGVITLGKDASNKTQEI